MSWDAILFKERFNLEDDEHELAILGKSNEVIKSLKAIFPHIEDIDERCGILDESQFSIEFNVGEEEYVDCIMLHVRGEGNPIYVLRLIHDTLGWEVFDCQTSEFMDLDNLESWEEFKAYRDKLVGDHLRDISDNS